MDNTLHSSSSRWRAKRRRDGAAMLNDIVLDDARARSKLPSAPSRRTPQGSDGDDVSDKNQELRRAGSAQRTARLRVSPSLPPSSQVRPSQHTLSKGGSFAIPDAVSDPNDFKIYLKALILQLKKTDDDLVDKTIRLLLHSGVALATFKKKNDVVQLWKQQTERHQTPRGASPPKSTPTSAQKHHESPTSRDARAGSVDLQGGNHTQESSEDDSNNSEIEQELEGEEEPGEEELGEEELGEEELGEEDPGEEQLEEEGRPAKRRRLMPKTVTLDDALEVIVTQADLGTDDTSCALGPLAKTLIQRLKTQPGYSDDDFAVIGPLLLADTFGDAARRRVADLVMRSQSGRYADQASRAATNASKTCQDLRALGQDGLAGFVAGWAEVVRSEEGSNAEPLRISMLNRKVELLRSWDEWTAQVHEDQGGELSQFLTKQGFPHKQRGRLQSRLSGFLCKQMDIRDNKTFTNRIYQWRPLGILVEAFGPGVFLFSPPGLERFSRKLASSESLTKEERFTGAVQLLAKEAPVICQLCEAAYETIVQPILEGRRIGPTAGTRLALRKDKDAFRSLSLWDLVRAEVPGATRIQSVEEGDEG